MSWIDATDLAALPAPARAELARLQPMHLPRGTDLFHPGDRAEGFPVVIHGRIEVFLIGPSGRDILLYAVEPGQTCVQTTLGLLGGEPYGGEAIAMRDSAVVMIPRGLFLRLMDEAAQFREFVFRAFAERMQSTVHVLEKVAFLRVEARLAQALLDLAEDGIVHATQAELASRIGSAREVVSRRLDTLARRGWLTRDRGQVRLSDLDALRNLAETGGLA
ncbi:MAG: CRP/FNR family transcriptional regulator, anaerobic regulatory protein [Rhodobacteraceae bacterium HLUCCA08]|nr:MAG: CRP/FNR family transcriptional regulator, anaerobic regulatory protein [Rhodobacteraceae bacterium HLUCCA08]